MIVLLLTALLQSSSAIDVDRARAAASATVRGHVYRADGRPLPRAAIVLTPVPVDRRGIRAGRADADGSFEIALVPPGRYRVTASRAGYVTREFGQQGVNGRGEIIELPAGRITPIDIALPAAGAIEGRVVDENGDSIEGAIVEAFQSEFVRGRRRLVPVGGRSRPTNDLGGYRLFGLRPGTYVVTASVGQVNAADWPGYARTYFPGSAAPSEAQAIVLGMSEEKRGVDIPLAPARTARLSGRFLNAAGEPGGGSLTLVPAWSSGGVIAPVGARIARSGEFEFSNVAPGRYVIQAYRGQVNASTEGEFASMPVTVAGVDLANLVVQTKTGSTITGRVVFEGAAPDTARDIRLVAAAVDADATPQSGNEVRADIARDGTLRLSGISGPRRLRVRQTPDGWALKAILRNGTDITDAVLQLGQANLTGVEVVLTSAITVVSGTVVDGRSRPAAEGAALVFAVDRELWYPESRYVRMAPIDEQGRFAIEGLPPGTYRVGAVPVVSGDGWQDPALLEALATGTGAVTVTVGPGEKRAVSARFLQR